MGRECPPDRAGGESELPVALVPVGGYDVPAHGVHPRAEVHISLEHPPIPAEVGHQALLAPFSGPCDRHHRGGAIHRLAELEDEQAGWIRQAIALGRQGADQERVRAGRRRAPHHGESDRQHQRADSTANPNPAVVHGGRYYEARSKTGVPSARDKGGRSRDADVLPPRSDADDRHPGEERVSFGEGHEGRLRPCVVVSRFSDLRGALSQVYAEQRPAMANTS